MAKEAAPRVAVNANELPLARGDQLEHAVAERSMPAPSWGLHSIHVQAPPGAATSLSSWSSASKSVSQYAFSTGGQLGLTMSPSIFVPRPPMFVAPAVPHVGPSMVSFAMPLAAHVAVSGAFPAVLHGNALRANPALLHTMPSFPKTFGAVHSAQESSDASGASPRTKRAKVVDRAPQVEGRDEESSLSSKSSGSARAAVRNVRQGRWSKSEHRRFLDAVARHGKGNWSLIAKCIGTRTTEQTRSHAQQRSPRTKTGSLANVCDAEPAPAVSASSSPSNSVSTQAKEAPTEGATTAANDLAAREAELRGGGATR